MATKIDVARAMRAIKSVFPNVRLCPEAARGAGEPPIDGFRIADEISDLFLWEPSLDAALESGLRAAIDATLKKRDVAYGNYLQAGIEVATLTAILSETSEPEVAP